MNATDQARVSALEERVTALEELTGATDPAGVPDEDAVPDPVTGEGVNLDAALNDGKGDPTDVHE